MVAKAMKLFLEQANKTKPKMNTPKRGKQTVKQLTRQGAGVSKIEITDKNIKAFEGIARKYGVDYALKKDTTEIPTRWLVFFKSKDGDALMTAFKEFSTKQLKRTSDKPSVLENLRNLMAKVKSQVIDKTKNKDRGREL